MILYECPTRPSCFNGLTLLLLTKQLVHKCQCMWLVRNMGSQMSSSHGKLSIILALAVLLWIVTSIRISKLRC